MTDFFHDLDCMGTGGLLLLPPHYNEDPEDSLQSDQEILSSGANEEVAQTAPGFIWVGTRNVQIANLKEKKTVLDHFKNRKGKLRSFWAPSFSADFRLAVATGGPGTHTFVVEKNNFDWVFEEDRYGLYVETADDRFIWKITGYNLLDDYGLAALTVKSDLGRSFTPEEVLLMSLVRKVRYDNDALTLPMVTTFVGRTSFGLYELPSEADFLQELLFDDLTTGWEHQTLFSGQVMFTDGVWDAESNPVDGQGGTRRKFRTNQTGSGFDLQTKIGTTTIGILLDDLPYDIVTTDGRALEPMGGFYGWRAREINAAGEMTGAWSDWTVLPLNPHPDFQNGFVLVAGLDGTKRWRVQIRRTQARWPTQQGLYYTRWYEPGQMGMVDPGTGSAVQPVFGAYVQWKGILVNAAGGVETFADARRKIKVLVVHDSNADGALEKDPGDLLEPDLEESEFDIRGTLKQWAFLLVDMLEEERPDLRLCLNNTSFGQRYYQRLPASLRAANNAYADVADLADRIEFVTNSRPFPGSNTPDIILFGHTVNDLYLAYLNPTYGATTSIDDAEEVVQRSRTLWPNVRWVVAPYPLQDSQFGNNPVTGVPINVVKSLQDLVDTVHSGDSWISLADLTPLGDTIGRPNHLTISEHQQAAEIVYPLLFSHILALLQEGSGNNQVMGFL